MIMIKSKINSKKAKSRDFPKIMEHTGYTLIVFFSSPCNGIILKSNNNSFKVGETDNTWVMSMFEDFEGSITLENK